MIRLVLQRQASVGWTISGCAHVVVLFVVHSLAGLLAIRGPALRQDANCIRLSVTVAAEAEEAERATTVVEFAADPSAEAHEVVASRPLPISPVGTLPATPEREEIAPVDEASLPSPSKRNRRPLVEAPVAEPLVTVETPAIPRPPAKAVLPRPLVAADQAAAVSSASSRASQGTESELPPHSVFNPPPEYPPEALAAKVEGRVVLRVRVTGEGRVESAAIYRSSGHALLDQAALTAVRRWRFEPARRWGFAVATEIAVPVRFRIDAAASP